MKVGHLMRQMMEEELRRNFKDTDTFFILTYFKVTASALNILREDLRKTGSKLFVTKNILLKRIFLEKDLTKDFANSVLQNTAIVFVKDLLAVAKSLSGFMKNYPGIEFKAGVMKGRFLDLNDFKLLSSLPSLEFLKAKILLQMKTPIISLTNILKANLNRFILLLQAIKEKRGLNDTRGSPRDH